MSARRRGLLGAVAAATAFSPTRGNTRVLPTVAKNPDAALIRACDAYGDRLDAVNNGRAGDDDSGHPAWAAYEACRDAVTEGAPQTMAGVLAMCRAIKAEARGRDGEPIGLHGTIAEDWALEVVNALLRLNGDAA